MLWSKDILGKGLTGKGRSCFNRMSKAVLHRKPNHNKAQKKTKKRRHSDSVQQ